MTLSIDARATRWGGRTAIVDVAETDRFAPAGTVDEDHLTYDGLATLSRVVAATLAEEGVDTGDTVALVSRNRIATLATVFACQRLGATFAPVSHRLTPVTVENPLSIVRPTLVVAESAQRDLVRGLDGDRTIGLADLFDAAETMEDGDGEESPAGDQFQQVREAGPQVPPESDDAPLLALHGTDGVPVGTYSAAAVEATCLSTLLTWGLGRADRTVLLRPLSRPDGLLGVALPVLYAGGQLAIDRAFDPADAATAVRRVGATFLAGEPTEFRELLASEGGAEAIESVEWVSVSGRPPATLLEDLTSRCPAVRRSFGGLLCPNALTSRAGGIRTDTRPSHEDSDREPIEPRLVGRPALDVDARLVADGTVVPGAGTGELTVAGPTVATDVLTDAGMGEATSGTATDASSTDGRSTWRRTGYRFRRDEEGRYYLLDAVEPATESAGA